MRYPEIASRLFDRPLLVSEAKLQAILGFLGPRIGIEMPKMEDDGGLTIVVGEDERRSFQIVNGVARIPVLGTLVHRGSWIDGTSGLTGYNIISAQLREALEASEVRAIALDVDSPGGEAVSDVFRLSDEIFAARGRKPIVAVVNDLAASAAYLIASAADEIVVGELSPVGSVGVVWTHIDMSSATKKAGIAVTHLYAGARKVDGSKYLPLSQEAREGFQADIDDVYQRFVERVARNRNMSEEAVIATQAAVFKGAAAIEIGFADRIGTLDEVIASFATPPALAISTTENSNMSNPPAGPAPATAEPPADLSAIRTEAAATARAEERARIGAILGAPEAEGRAELAQHLAFETDMTVAAAQKLLAKAPAEVAPPAATQSPFEAEMASLGNPQVGPDVGPVDDDEEAEAEKLAASAVSAFRAARI